MTDTLSPIVAVDTFHTQGFTYAQGYRQHPDGVPFPDVSVRIDAAGDGTPAERMRRIAEQTQRRAAILEARAAEFFAMAELFEAGKVQP